MTLLEVYLERAVRTPGAPALVHARAPHQVTFTWAQLVDRAREISLALPPRARVAVTMRDHPDLVPSVLAVWSQGGVVVPVDSEWGSQVREVVLTRSGATHLLDSGGVSPNALANPDAPALPADTAMISYTSGSTSSPKGVVLTHGQLLHAYETAGVKMREHLGHQPTVFGASMRMSGLGVLGMTYLWPAVMGMSVVVLPELGLTSARDHWRLLREHGVQLTYLVPPLVELLNRMGQDPGGEVVTCLSGGAPLSAAGQSLFQDRFDAVLLNVYGMTEVAFAAFFGDLEDGRGTHSIGVPVTVSARLRDAQGAVVEGEGEGEIELSGPSQSCGYYDNDEDTAALLREGWVRSGDLGRRDAEGRYWITGRRKDVVLKGGFTIYLHEIEEAAGQIPGVVESVAVRLDLPTGEDVGLIVFAPTVPAAEAIQKELSATLGRQRAPRRVVLTAEPLARLGQEKLDRRAAMVRWQEMISN